MLIKLPFQGTSAGVCPLIQRHRCKVSASSCCHSWCLCPVAVACLTIGFVPTEGLRWSESQHSVSPRARGGDRDGTVAGASGSLPNILPNPNTNLNPNPSWSRQRELLMHLLPWYTAAAAAAQAQPGNCALTRASPPRPPWHQQLATGDTCTTVGLHADQPGPALSARGFTAVSDGS